MSKYREFEWLLLGIFNSLRKEPFDPFKKPHKKNVAMSIDELERLLSRPRREVGHGN